MRLLCTLLALAIVAMPLVAQDETPAPPMEETPASPGQALFDAGVDAYKLGAEQTSQGNSGEAAAHFEAAKAKFIEALEHYEGNETVLTWLGTTCYELRQWDEAIDYLSQATEADPTYPVAFNNLGNAHLEKGSALMNEDEAAARPVLAKAVQAYLKAMELDPAYFYPVYNLALTYTRTKEWDKAFNRFHEALKLAPEDTDRLDVQKSFAQALKDAKEYEKAIARYGEALKLDPNCVSCNVQLGWLHSKLAQWPSAEGAYKASIGSDEGLFDAQLGLGIALYSQGKFAEAKAPLAKATELRVDSFEAWYNLGLTSDGLEDLDAGAAAYTKATELKPTDAAALNNLGVVVYKQGKPCDAIAHFQAAIAADAGYVMAYINLALALEACGQDDDAALKHWQDTVTRFPRQASAHCGLANAFYRRGQVNQALEEYLKCLLYDDRNIEAHNNVGLIHMERDQLDEALAHFRQALAVAPNYVPAINNLGVLYEKQKKVDEAKAQYRKALEIDPNYSKAKENLRRLEGTEGG